MERGEEGGGGGKRPDRMAIGGEGGFQVDAKKFVVEEEQVCAPVCLGAGEWVGYGELNGDGDSAGKQKVPRQHPACAPPPLHPESLLS